MRLEGTKTPFIPNLASSLNKELETELLSERWDARTSPHEIPRRGTVSMTFAPLTFSFLYFSSIDLKTDKVADVNNVSYKTIYPNM